jgi:hypothetical protein
MSSFRMGQCLSCIRPNYPARVLMEAFDSYGCLVVRVYMFKFTFDCVVFRVRCVDGTALGLAVCIVSHIVLRTRVTLFAFCSEVVHMIYITAKGIPLTTAASCWAVGGRLMRLQRSDFLEHVAADQAPTVFTISQALQDEYPEVHKAMRAACGAKESKWQMVKRPKTGVVSASGDRGGRQVVPSSASSGQLQPKAPASGGAKASPSKKPVDVDVTSLGSLWVRLQMMRRVRNTKDAPLLWRSGRAIVV